MYEIYADLHVHIGRSEKGKPIKITAARSLNFANIAKECVERKGINLVGIIDCASPYVIEDIEEFLKTGEAYEIEDGGIVYKDKVCIILGSEIETSEINDDGKTGSAHNLCYFPHLVDIKGFSNEMKGHIKNMTLSSQRADISAYELIDIVHKYNGVLVPAHAFTPHKSFYGNCTSSLKRIFKEKYEKIPAIELGLSSDTFLADKISELETKTFLTNSDAHSLPKIAREYNKMLMESPSFKEFIKVLKNEDGRKIVANYGLDPKLGKYHRTFCEKCGKQLPDEAKFCNKCGAMIQPQNPESELSAPASYGAQLPSQMTYCVAVVLMVFAVFMNIAVQLSDDFDAMLAMLFGMLLLSVGAMAVMCRLLDVTSDFGKVATGGYLAVQGMGIGWLMMFRENATEWGENAHSDDLSWKENAMELTSVIDSAAWAILITAIIGAIVLAAMGVSVVNISERKRGDGWFTAIGFGLIATAAYRLVEGFIDFFNTEDLLVSEDSIFDYLPCAEDVLIIATLLCGMKYFSREVLPNIEVEGNSSWAKYIVLCVIAPVVGLFVGLLIG